MPSLMNGVASHLSNSFMRVSKRLVLPRLPDLRANAAQIMLHASGSDDESCYAGTPESPSVWALVVDMVFRTLLES